MRANQLFLALLIVAISSSAGFAQSRTWRDVYGNAVSGSWQRFSKDKKGNVANDRVVIRTGSKTVGLKFWELMPDDQRFVKDKLAKEGTDGDHLEVSDVPRDWKSRTGQKGRGQFLQVDKDGSIIVIVQGEKKSFQFSEFVDDDQDYIRDLLAQDGKENLVPAKPKTATSTSPPATSRPGFPATSRPGFPTPSQPGFPQAGISRPTTTPRSSLRDRVTEPTTPSYTSTRSNNSLSNSTAFSPSTTSPSIPTTTPSIPEPSIPTFTPPTTPTISTPSIPRPSVPTFQEVFQCSNCRSEVSESATSCPKCGSVFDYVEHADGRREYTSGGSGLSRRGQMGAVKLAVLAIVVVGGAVWRFLWNS